jgi:F-type H+-transporting ATPase subunit delta
MAELATIARPYAEALFKAQAADLDNTAVWLDELAALADNAELRQFAEHPNADAAQVLKVMAGGKELPAAARNLLGLIIENGRLAVLSDIARQFRALKNAVSGSTEAVVYSAFPMDEKALAEVAVALEKRFGRKLGVTVEIDASLIGGIRAVVGDEVLDTSVKARLEQMKMALIA